MAPDQPVRISRTWWLTLQTVSFWAKFSFININNSNIKLGNNRNHCILPQYAETFKRSHKLNNNCFECKDLKIWVLEAFSNSLSLKIWIVYFIWINWTVKQIKMKQYLLFNAQKKKMTKIKSTEQIRTEKKGKRKNINKIRSNNRYWFKIKGKYAFLIDLNG